MANQNGRPIAPARKLVAAVVGTIAVFVMLFGLGMSSWAIVALGLAMLILAIGLGMVNVVRRGARAWVAGSAQVKAVSEAPATAIYGRAELQIVIVAPGLPTSEVTVRDPRVPVVKWPRVGDTLPVTVDVDDMRRVRINWDEAETYEATTLNVPPTYYEEDLPDDDLLGGEPEPPPWATRDRQWGRGPDEPPPPPPSPRTGDADGPPPPPPRAGLMEEQTSPVIVRDAPGGPIVEGQLVEPDYDYTSPLPQRARTATATPPRPAEKPRPRPRPHAEPPSASPVSPASAPAASAASPAVADEDESAPVAPAQRIPTEAAAASGPVDHDPEIDLSLDGDPEPAPETRPAAQAAVDQDLIAPPAVDIPGAAATAASETSSSQDRAGRVLDAEDAPPSRPKARSADDVLLGDLEPPPWEVRAQQPEAVPASEAAPDLAPDGPPASAFGVPASEAPSGVPASEAPAPASEARAASASGIPASDAPLASASGASTSGVPASSVWARPGSDSAPASDFDARPAAEGRQRPRPTAVPDAPQAVRPAGENDRPRSAAQSTGLAAAAGAVVAAGIAALGNAFRNRKQEEPRPSSEAARPAPAQRPGPRPARPNPARPDAPRLADTVTPRQAAAPSTTGSSPEDDPTAAAGAVPATDSAPTPNAADPGLPTEPPASRPGAKASVSRPATEPSTSHPAAEASASHPATEPSTLHPAAESASPHPAGESASEPASEPRSATAASPATEAASTAVPAPGSAARPKSWPTSRWPSSPQPETGTASTAAPEPEPGPAQPSGPGVRPGQVYTSPTAFGPGGGSGTGSPADTRPRREPTPIRPGSIYSTGTSGEPTPGTPPPAATEAAVRRGKPWADLEGGFEPDERADDVITAYPSARTGPAGAIHGVGITVLVTDLERSVAFYRDMLGFYEIDSGSGSAVLASGDTRLVLRAVHDVSGAAGRLVYLNLEVGDVEAVYEELKRKGVQFVHGPRPVNRGDRLELWAASLHDPDKHNIAITQWRAIR